MVRLKESLIPAGILIDCSGGLYMTPAITGVAIGNDTPSARDNARIRDSTFFIILHAPVI